MKKQSILAGIFGMAIFSCPSTTRGGVFQSEDFDYPASELQQAEGGTGWNGPWESRGEGKSSIYALMPTGHLPDGYELPVAASVLQLQPMQSTQRVLRRFSPPIELNSPSPQSYYFSFTFSRVDQSNQAGYETFGFVFCNGSRHILSFEINSAERLQISYPPGNLVVTGEKEVVKFSKDIQSSPRYLFVGRMVIGQGEGKNHFDFSIFDETESVAHEPQEWGISLQADASESLDTLEIMAAQYLENIFVGNIRIGSDFASVVRP